MSLFRDNEYIFRKQAWEDYQDYMVEIEDETILNQLNKMYNRKGYLLVDYMNGCVGEEYC